MKKIIYFFIALFWAGVLHAQDTTYITSSASWKYLDNGSNQGTGWRSWNFNDTSWAAGNAELGYGDGGETTVVSYGSNANNKYITTYFRKRIYISDTSLYKNFYLQLIRDDGAVVYANDSEIVRNNLPGGSITYNTKASSAIGGSDESAWYNYTVSTRYFKTGWNVIAIELHQSDSLSSDLSFNLTLKGIRKPATALSFNGSNQYVSFGAASSLNAQNFTIETWFKRTGTGVTGSTGTGGVSAAIPLVTKGRDESDGSNVDMNYYFGIRSSDSVLCADFEEGTGQATPGLNHPVYGVTSIQRNVWYHAAVTYDGQKWKLYLNGNLERTDSVGRLPQFNSTQHAGLATSINSSGGRSGYFAGILDEVRIWNYARSQTQIQALVNTEISGPQNGLIGYYRLNDSIAPAATSISNNGSSAVTGTAGNSPLWTGGSPFNANITPPNNPPAAPTAVSPADASVNRNSNTLSVNVTDPENKPLTVTFFGRVRPAAADSPNFTIIPLPDTQFYTEQSGGASNSTFKAQTNWVVANKNSRNIRYLVQLGDCVQNGDNGGNDVEWKRADTSMRILENPATTQLTHGLPYGINVGNHDQSPAGATGTTTFYNQYFGSARFNGRTYYGGHYGNNNDNHFQLFSASGMDFISINLEYDTNADTLVLKWADSLLKAYPTHRGIVNSHWLINSDASWGAQGQAVYNKLKVNSNLHLMLCGHINPNGEARRTDTYNGNTVHTLLSDFQDRTGGGNGWLRIMEFRPSENKIYVFTYSPTLNQYETDANSQFVLDYNMTDGSYTNLGSVTVSSGSVAGKTWTGLAANTKYDWYVSISDSVNTTTSNVFRFTNDPVPVVTSPNGGETWQAGSVHPVKWNANGIQTVKIEYSTNGSSWNTITNATPGTGGLYNWTLPNAANTPASTYRIRISDTSYAAASDTSDALFTIASDTLIKSGTSWKYLDNGSNQNTAWRDSSFNDASWASGVTEFGYGDGGETTLVNACGTVAQNPSCTNKYITTYFRKKIYIPNLADFSNFFMEVVRDDGPVVYVNGNEVWRDNLPTGTISYNTLAPVAIGNADETAWNGFTVPKSYFVNGWNTIAVEMHQQSGTSSDMSFNLRMKGNPAPSVPVIVMSPNGGENWTVGTLQNITWQTQSSVNKIKLEYSTNGTTWTTIANGVNATLETYSWSVPNTPSSNCLIRISDSANVASYDTCNTRFTISSAPQATLIRGPYLQIVTKNSAIIRWRTDVPAPSRVRWGTTAGVLSNYKDDSVYVTDHEVKITGLLTYTRYYYSLGGLYDTLQGDTANYFRTLTVPGDDLKLLRIGVIGDCGNASTNQINVKNQLVNYLGANYMDSWILSGDNAYNSGTESEFQAQFFNIYKNDLLKKYPLWPAPGNHDYENGSAARQNDHNMPYYNMFTMPTAGEAGGLASGTEAFYSYDIGNVHFLSLDSYGKENNATRLYDTTGAQVTWIKNDLTANTNKKWIVAYWHHPPYTMGSHNSDSEGELVNIRTNFIKILERYGVDLIITGHSHDYERSKLMKGHYGNEASFNAATHHLSSSSAKYDSSSNSCPYIKDTVINEGTVYVVSGSAGQLGGQQGSFPHAAMQYSNATNGGSMILEVQGNRLDAKWICADGVIRDKFTMLKNVNQKRNYTVDYGDTLNLSASWNGSYSWSSSAGNTKTVQVIPDSTKKYTVKDQYTCLADSFHVTVNFPSLTASAMSSVSAKCANAGISIPFTASGKFFNGNQFRLQLSDSAGNFGSPAVIGTLSATASGTINASIPAGTASGNYRLRIVSTIPVMPDLLTSNSFVINKNLPQLSFSSNKTANTLCQGDSVYFNASGASAYEFFVNGVSQGAAASASAFGTASISDGEVVKVKGSNACGMDSTSITMTVTGIPNVSLSSNDTDDIICQNSSVMFTASGATTYSFFLNGDLQGTPGSSNTFSSASLALGQHTINVSGSNACFSNSDSILIDVIGIPSVSISSNDTDNTICQGSHITFTGNGADTYEFFVNNISQGGASAGNSFGISSLNNGQQKIKVKGSNLCFSKSDSVSVLVIGIPAVSMSSNKPDHTICFGNSISFTATGANAYQFFIHGTSQGAASATANFSTTSLAAGQQMVKVTGNNACFASSDSLNVTVTGIPAVVLGSNKPANSICQGENIIFGASGANAYEFFINGSSQGAASSNNGLSIFSLPAGQHQVKVKGDNGCFTKNDSVTVTVTGAPAITFSSNDADNSICQGSNIRFTGTGAATYQFFIDGISQGAASAVNNFSSSSLNPGIRWIKVKGNNSCASSNDSVKVTVIGSPLVALACSDADKMICTGDHVDFTASGAGSYQFFINGVSQGAPSSTATMNTSSLSDGQYVKAEGNNGCFTVADSIRIGVNSLPVVGLNSDDPDNSICEGVNVNFTASGAKNYEYYVNDVLLSPASTNSWLSLWPKSSLNLQVKGISAFGCSSLSPRIEFKVNPTPAVALGRIDSIYHINDPLVLLTGVPAGGMFSGPGVKGNKFNPIEAGLGGPYTIRYVYMDPQSGCAARDSMVLSVELYTSVLTFGNGNRLNVYPNPASDLVNIDLDLHQNAEIEVSLSDITGRAYMVRSRSLVKAGSERIILNRKNFNLASGSYLLRIDVNGQQKTIKIIFQ